MSEISRRTLLRGAVAGVGAAALGGPFAGFLAEPAGAATKAAGSGPGCRCGPVPDLRDGRSGSPAAGLPVPLVPRHRVPDHARRRHARCPGRHDGMAAFPGPDGNVMPGPQPRGQQPGAGRSAPRHAVRPDGRRRHDDHRGDPVGEVVEAFTSLNGTQMNCSGGADAVGQLDHVRGDGQRARRRPRLHRRRRTSR